ncbi:Transcriptional regulator, LysR family [Lachnospiraceae bacterium TWA4]|nr:Transcriptional regulator, LysR family [Lachnospiraceae bacterium TWA4]
MNLKQLEAFIEVADSGSFSKAAKKLYLTQPTISAHILSLEKELMIRLFVRNTKEVKLSKDGETLYQYAKPMIEMQDKIKSEFGINQKEEDTHCVNIASSTVPAQYLLPDILSNYSERYTGEVFKLTETDSEQVIDKVSKHLVDVGFTGTMLEKLNCKYLPIYQDELVLVMPNNEKYRQIKENETSLTWIKNESFIVREEGSGTRKESERLLKKAGIDFTKLKVIASIENPEIIKTSIKNGMGITIMSKLAVKKEIKQGELLEFPLSLDKKKRNLYLVYNKNYQLSKSCEKFVNTVKSICC